MNHQLKQAACRYSATAESHVRQHDRLPDHRHALTGDVDGRCKIAGTLMPTVDAPKAIPRRAVTLVDQSATGTRPAGVTRIDGNQRHTHQLGLVGQTLTEMSESPRVVRSPMFLANRCPFANPGQIFDHDSTNGVLGCTHDRFADTMVHVTLVAPFLPSAMTQQPFGGFRPLRLEFGPQAIVTSPHVRDVGAGEDLAIASRGKVFDAQVNTQETLGLEGFDLRHVDGYVQKEHPVAMDEIRLSARTRFEMPVVGPDHEGHDFPTVDGQDRNAIKPLPAQDSLIVRDGAKRSEFGSDIPVTLVAFDHLRDGSNGHLRRQIEVVPNIVVDESLQYDLVGASMTKSCFGDGSASGVESFHRSSHTIRLRDGRLELNLCRQLHGKDMDFTLNMTRVRYSLVDLG